MHVQSTRRGAARRHEFQSQIHNTERSLCKAPAYSVLSLRPSPSPSLPHTTLPQKQMPQRHRRMSLTQGDYSTGQQVLMLPWQRFLDNSPAKILTWPWVRIPRSRGGLNISTRSQIGKRESSQNRSWIRSLPE